MRNRTSGEDLVVLERRELSYHTLCATAAMVRYAQFFFPLMCCARSMLRTGSSFRPRHMNVSDSLRYVWVAGQESGNREVTKNVAGVRELRRVSYTHSLGVFSQEVPHFPIDVVVFEDECKSLSVDTGVGFGVVNEAAIGGQPFLSTMLYDGNHSIDGVMDLAGRAGALLQMGEGVVCVSEWGEPGLYDAFEQFCDGGE